MRRSFRSGISRWVVATLVVLCAAPLPAAADDPVPTYYIQVNAATEPYGPAPLFVYQRVYAELPPGATLSGGATCSQVFQPGYADVSTRSVYGTSPDDPLPPDTYQFVQDSCSMNPGNPLTLSGISGNYNLQLVAGSYTVLPGSTAIGAVGFQGTITDGVPTPTVLTAIVFDTSREGVELIGKTVRFDIQLSNGVFIRNACSAVTSRNETGDNVASCRLSDDNAKALYNGAGVWHASFAGDSYYGPSSAVSTVSGQLTPAQVAANLQNAAKNTVTLVAVYVPPECDNPYAGISDGSIIEVSLGQLNCSQLQGLQIATTIVFGVATSIIGGEATYTALAYNAAQRSLNALKYTLFIAPGI